MKITIDYIGGEERETAIIQRFVSKLLDKVEILKNKRFPGKCHDCIHERVPFSESFRENLSCPYRKEDGSCWTAPPEWRAGCCPTCGNRYHLHG